MKILFFREKKYRKIIVLVGIALIIGLVLAWKRLPEKKCEHCNIVMVDIDVLRADELPCYGYSRNTTPNICQFAKKATIFKDNYSTSYWTLPSMFSTITSMLPTFHKVRTEFINKLSPDTKTLAEVLHSQGYRTVYIGDGQNPALLTKDNGGLRGYDIVTKEPIEKVIADLSKSSQPWFIHYYLVDLHMPYLLPENVKPMEDLPAPKNLPINQTDFDRMLNTYLKKHYKQIFNEKAIGKYGSVILAPDKADDTSVTKLFNDLRWTSKSMTEYFIDSWKPIFNSYMDSFDKNNPNDVAYIRMMYDTKLKLADEQLQSLFIKLETKPFSENTISIIMSDHGEAFGEHGTFSHDNNSYTELYHTPLIIRAPGLPAKIVDQTSSNLDIFPTVLDLNEIKKLDSFQGKSLVDSVNKKTETKSFSLSEYSDGVILQNHDWLYFLPFWVDKFENSMLFDRNKDPKEKNNAAKQNLELTHFLYKQADLLRSYNGIIYKPEEIPSDIKLNPEKIERLKKEGYF